MFLSHKLFAVLGVHRAAVLYTDLVAHAAEKAQAELNKTLDEAIEKTAKINDFAPAKEAPAEK